LVKIKVIVIGYNRLDGLQRLIESLEETKIPSQKLNVHLHICLDGGADVDVQSFASTYKTVNPGFRNYSYLARDENYGLAQHITSCWDSPEENDDEWALFLEDDTTVQPMIFHAFLEALELRSPGIQAIAMHGQRVNQYCWKNHVRRYNCPEIFNECHTQNASDSMLGALTCFDSFPSSSWITTQIPSSWGAFYSLRAWSTFQDYYTLWQNLSDGHKVNLELPLSMSNEWSKSWKRPMMELFHFMGWTSLYRNVPEQASLAITHRGKGVHTKQNATKYEKMSRCLIELPPEDAYAPSKGQQSIPHYDYCSYEVEHLQVLRKRGAALVKRLSQLYQQNLDKDHIHPLQPIVRLLEEQQDEVTDQPFILSDSLASATAKGLIPAHGTFEPFSSELILVTTAHVVNREFETFCKQWKKNDKGNIKVLVVGTAPICVYLRNYERVHCLPERDFVGKNNLPIITKMLQAGLDAALPGVTRYVGVMNSDISFGEGQLEPVMSTLSKQLCNATKAKCVVVGQRHDVDWKTGKSKLHKVFGMDYFIFTVEAARWAVGHMPPLVVGRVRWDSHFMGSFVLQEDMHVVDATPVLQVTHFMDFDDKYFSKTHNDSTNHLLATKGIYRLGRVDYSNYQLVRKSSSEIEVRKYKATQESKSMYRFNQERYEYDYLFEKATEFTYSPNGIFPHAHCFCALLQQFGGGEHAVSKQYCHSKSLMKFNSKSLSKGMPQSWLVVLPYDSLQYFVDYKNGSLSTTNEAETETEMESLFITHAISQKRKKLDKCCWTSHEFSKKLRPRSALIMPKEWTNQPVKVTCLRNSSFPYGIGNDKSEGDVPTEQK